MSPKYLQVFLLFIIFTACKQEEKEKEVPLHFESVSVIKKSGEGCLSDDFNCTIISIDVPVAKGGKEISENINARLKEHIFSLVFSEEPSAATSYEEYAKEFISNQQRTSAEFQESVPWKAVISGSLIRESDNLISIAIDSEVFTGGAHGYRSISYFNFDAHTGRSMEHKDLFTQDFLNYAEKAFREQYDIPQEESINSTGLWFEHDKFSLPINIGIDKEHVILVYNSYEVASYAEGEFKLEFPIEEVQDYLKIELE